MNMRAFSTAILASAVLIGCDLPSLPVPTEPAGSGGVATVTTATESGGVGGSGGGAGEGGAPCDPATCPQPLDRECAKATCDGDACGVFNFNEESLCGFAGHCNGAGACIGLQDPIKCDGACDDDGECSKGYCDTYQGQCAQFFLGNATACELGKGRCNAKTGACCTGYQSALCDDITDPVMCFTSCVNGDTTCTYQCTWACPLGTIALADQGFCFPAL